MMTNNHSLFQTPSSIEASNRSTKTVVNRVVGQADTTETSLTTPTTCHHDVICQHVFHQGFTLGRYSDLTLCFLQAQDANGHGWVFHVHRLFMIQSPYLNTLLQDLEMKKGKEGCVGPVDMTITLHDPNIDGQGLSLALGHLYSSVPHTYLTHLMTGQQEQTPHSLTPQQRSALLRSVLASAYMLQLEDLASTAASFIKADITRDTYLDYCQCVTQSTLSTCSFIPMEIMNQIKDYVFQFLCKGLIKETMEQQGRALWGHAEGNAYKELVSSFASLPFEWLKKVIESEVFEVPSNMERYRFAKQVLECRCQSFSQLVLGEENVLLSFGASKPGTTGITLVRKLPKSSPSVHFKSSTMAVGSERKVWKVQQV